jgi:uncharacterized OB-fold protein
VEATAPPFRILPKLTDHNRDFWTGGARGELRFWRCQDCGFYIHPPQPLCPMCRSKNMKTEAVSGRATLATFSVNHQPWMPGPELPYIVAIVEIVEQPSVRLTTNLVNCAPDQIQSAARARDLRTPRRCRGRHLPCSTGRAEWLPANA